MNKLPIAIVGATGLVGTTLIALLEAKNLSPQQLYFVASAQSAGKYIRFQGQDCVIHDLATFNFEQTKIAFFCVSNDLASQYIPKAVAAGNIVIDKSYYYRQHEHVPLIIPEVNLAALANFRKMGIIANPNCNTIPIAVGIKPIYDYAGIERINISTYQSVSGAGKDAVTELHQQAQQWLRAEPIQHKFYTQQMVFNVIPHVDDFQNNGYTREEMKMVWELKKIFNDNSLAINPTAVRVPVFCGHAAAVHLEIKTKITANQALELFAQAPGIKLVTGDFPYATPVAEAEGRDEVYVGRVREDISHDKGLNLWIVTDNLRKGAALNALQIAEHLISEHL